MPPGWRTRQRSRITPVITACSIVKYLFARCARPGCCARTSLRTPNPRFTACCDPIMRILAANRMTMLSAVARKTKSKPPETSSGPDDINRDDVDNGQNMPDVAEPPAQQPQTRKARSLRSAHPAGDHAAILQDKNDRQQGGQQPDDLHQPRDTRLRQTQQQGRLGDEIPVDRDVGQTTDPPHD